MSKKKFTKIFEHNLFGGDESISGIGSGLEQTRIIRSQLPSLFEEYGIKTILDAPCGDHFWFSKMKTQLKEYTGGDIVFELIEENNKKFSSDCKRFIEIDVLSNAIPCVDLIFCRDLLVHLSFSDAKKVINNFKLSGSTYLLTTTFTDRRNNFDLDDKLWRPLGLHKPPFSFPDPFITINEGCTENNGVYKAKSLGLWKLKDINNFNV